MAAATSLSVPALLEELRARRAAVAALKRSIKQSRQELAGAAAALKDLEDEARRRGVSIVNRQPETEGVGANHGRQTSTRSHY
jgi:hypothetical protein